MPAAGGEGPPAPPESLLALWLAAWTAEGGGRMVVCVARSEARARRLLRATRALAPHLDAVLFPLWDCLPYDRASPSRAVMGERMAALCRLRKPVAGGGRLVLTTPDALAQRVPPRGALEGIGHRLAVGDDLDVGDLRLSLLRTGYAVDERVDEAGEAAIRGATIEIFPADAVHPYRLGLDGGRVAEIRAY